MARNRGYSTIAKREKRVGDRLPYASHADANTIRLRSGALMQTILIEGFPFETAGTDELNYRLAVRETMLRGVGGSRFALYHHVVRRRASATLAALFKDPLCAHLDRFWQGRMSSRNLFVNDLFLTIVSRPSQGRIGLVERFARAGRPRSGHETRDIRALDGVRESLLASLAPYRPRALSLYDSEGGARSELVEFLSLILNGELRPALAPKGDIGHYLPYRRISFGVEAFELAGGAEESARLGAILSLKEYPSTTTPGIIDNLLRLPCEMVITESFAFAERQIAQERIDLAARRLRAADDDTVTLRRGLLEAKDN
ncbi:MAG: hypothetical protein WD076_06980, partial [Parvularculaceae bacterium]